MIKPLVLLITLSVVAQSATDPAAGASGNRFGAALTFARCVGLARHTPLLSPEDFEPIRTEFAEDGLTEIPDGGGWVFGDETGEIGITCYLEHGILVLQLMSYDAEPLGDAAAAALIQKADSVSTVCTTGLNLTMPAAPLRQGTAVGYIQESVHLTLPGWRWSSTEITIAWQEAPPN